MEKWPDARRRLPSIPYVTEWFLAMSIWLEYSLSRRTGVQGGAGSCPGGICFVGSLTPGACPSLLPLHPCTMDPYTIPQNPPSSSFLPSNYDNDDKPDQSAAFMKAPKRKRLAKAYISCSPPLSPF